MVECRNRWFVNQSQCAVQLRRMETNRSTVAVRVTNHSDVPLTPIIGLSNNGTTIVGTIQGTEIVPKANTMMLIPAKDSNDVLFKELYVFLYYSYSGDESLVEIGNGLEYDLMQYEAFSLLFLYGNQCDILDNNTIPSIGWVPVDSPEGVPSDPVNPDSPDQPGDDPDPRPVCDTLIEQCTTPMASYDIITCSYVDDAAICDAFCGCGIGHTFTVPRGDYVALCQAQFDLGKSGSPTGFVYARLYESIACNFDPKVERLMPDTDTGYLAQSDPVNINSLSGITSEWISFDFSEPNYCMKPGVTYFITVMALDSVFAEQDDFLLIGKPLESCGGNMAWAYFDYWACNAEGIRYKIYGKPC